ncbi:MAG: TetR/AcrR family transcriptional regulator [Deltaproteobacteria bacterium]|nr:TetR/AcrR family transcriptional regulator [Deltaproteobacteria bacterium]
MARNHDPEATRTAILEAAERLFAERGFSATSMSDIADASGVTKSLIHHHFQSKRKLWQDVKYRRFARDYAGVQMNLLTNPPGGDTIGMMRASIGEYFGFLRHNPRFVRLISWIIMEGHAELEQERGPDEELLKIGAGRIREAQERGEVRADIEPAFVITALLALCLHWFESESFFKSQIDYGDATNLHERYLDHIQKIVFEGILPRP